MWRAAPRMSPSLKYRQSHRHGAIGDDTTGGSDGPISAAPDPVARVNNAATKTVMTTIVDGQRQRM